MWLSAVSCPVVELVLCGCWLLGCEQCGCWLLGCEQCGCWLQAMGRMAI